MLSGRPWAPIYDDLLQLASCSKLNEKIRNMPTVSKAVLQHEHTTVHCNPLDQRGKVITHEWSYQPVHCIPSAHFDVHRTLQRSW